MKKAFCWILIMLLLLSGCGRVEKQPVSAAEREAMYEKIEHIALTEWWHSSEEAIFMKEHLKAGSVLFCYFDGKMSGSLIAAYDSEGGIVGTTVDDTDEHAFSILNRRSYVYAWPTDSGIDLLFCVRPDYPIEKSSFSLDELPPYKETAWYGIEPYDTVGTQPIFLEDSESYGGYPQWIFCTTVEDLKEGYELHYGDLVVTYDDIMAGLVIIAQKW